MSRTIVEKLQESEELRINIGINCNQTDLTNLNNDTEVVYKSTAKDKEDSWNSKSHSLKPDSQLTPKDSFFLYRTAFFVDLLAMVTAVGFSWTSPVLPKLQTSGPENPLIVPIDTSQTSIIVGILCVGAIIGPFPFGYLADKIGRKKTLIVIAIPMAIALVILAFTGEIKMYYFARLLYGVASGGVFTVINMYIGEITEDHNRGKFCCGMGIFFAIGILYPFSIGPMLTIRNFCLISLLPLLVFLIFFTIYCPETPIYLVKHYKADLAVIALMNLRDKTEEQVQKELKDLQIAIENQKQESGGVTDLFRNRITRREFMVVFGLISIQQVSGINVVMGFMENIFLATGSAVPPQVATTIIGVVQLLTVFVTTSVIDKLGRKFLFLSSIVGAVFSLMFLGLYFFLHKKNFSMLQHFWWLPVTSLFVYIISYNLGIGPVPWTILSEIFPNNVKASAAALLASSNFAISFVVTMAFPLLNEMLGMAQSFWIFGLCCILGFVFTYYVVPETKGKTFAEIQQIFSQ